MLMPKMIVECAILQMPPVEALRVIVYGEIGKGQINICLGRGEIGKGYY